MPLLWSGELSFLILDAIDRMSARDSREAGIAQLVRLVSTRIDPLYYKECLHVIFSAKTRSLWPYLIEPVCRVISDDPTSLKLVFFQILKCVADPKCHISCVSVFPFQLVTDKFCDRLFEELYSVLSDSVRVCGLLKILQAKFIDTKKISANFVRFVQTTKIDFVSLPYILSIWANLAPNDSSGLVLLEFVAAAEKTLRKRHPRICEKVRIAMRQSLTPSSPAVVPSLFPLESIHSEQSEGWVSKEQCIQNCSIEPSSTRQAEPPNEPAWTPLGFSTDNALFEYLTSNPPNWTDTSGPVLFPVLVEMVASDLLVLTAIEWILAGPTAQISPACRDKLLTHLRRIVSECSSVSFDAKYLLTNIATFP